MPTSHKSAVRAIDIAIRFVERDEHRLRTIIESEERSSEEKFEALRDLAYLSGLVVRELADAEVQSTDSVSATDETSAIGTLLRTVLPADLTQLTQNGRAECHGQVKHASFHQDVCDNLSEGVYFVDTERRITYWNHGARNLTGFQREEAVGKHCYNNFLNHMDADGQILCHAGCPLAATLKDGKAREAEVFLHHKSGHRVPVSVRVSPVVDNSGTLIGAVEVFSNIASQKALESRAKELEELAYRDSLTGLSNRRHIELKMHQVLQEVEQFGRKAGLLLLDIDSFKRVNDTHGHSAGDVVLKAVADRLAQTLRPGDAAGRWGGEEFLFIAMDVNVAELKAIGERCRDAIASCVVPIEGHPIRVTVSVGVSLLKRGESAEFALNRADEMLYIAKCQGGNTVKVRL